jgi:hypothetical protein
VLVACRVEHWRNSLRFPLFAVSSYIPIWVDNHSSVSNAPSKIPCVGISLYTASNDNSSQCLPTHSARFTLRISTSVPLTSLFQHCVWRKCPRVEFTVQSPFALPPLQRLHRYYGLIRLSYSPAEFRFHLYQQPLLNRTLPTLIFDLS